jgi:hypothetical protein
MRHANLKVTMDTYVQAVTDEKREAQNKLVKMILPVFRGQRFSYWTFLDSRRNGKFS